MGGPLILPFVSSGHILILVKTCDFSFCCILWIAATVEPLSYLLSCWVICDINGVNPGYIVQIVINCSIICNTSIAFYTHEVDGC